jgi:protein SCO1
VHQKSCLALLPLLLVICLSSCSSKSAVEPRHFDIHGKVVSVDPQNSQVTIAHEDIPGFMTAMTMSFKVKDRWVLDAAKPGDHINATLTVGDETFLEAVTITQTTGENLTSGGLREPQVGDQVPDFKFVNQAGKTVALHQFRGRPVLLTFIYTRCPLPDYCIRMSNNFAEVARTLKSAGLYSNAELLSISIDPQHDTPKVLSEYGRRYAADLDPKFANWQFLSADAEATRKAAQWFGLSYVEENNQIVHSLRTVLIGPDGKIAALYRGNDWKPSDAGEKMKQLLKPQPA